MHFVRLHQSDGIAEITLARPKVNALNRTVLSELAEAFQKVVVSDDVRGVLVRGEGRAFSAGLDLVEVGSLDPAGLEEFFTSFRESFQHVFLCPKPVAAAVEGHAIAGGLVIALSADHLVLRPEGYKLGLTELLVGVPFPRLAFEIVRNALSPRALRRLIYGAELLDPRDAFELGVGDELSDDPEQAARSWLARVIVRPAGAFTVAKRQIREVAWQRVLSAPPSEWETLVEAVSSPDAQEALRRAWR